MKTLHSLPSWASASRPTPMPARHQRARLATDAIAVIAAAARVLVAAGTAATTRHSALALSTGAHP